MKVLTILLFVFGLNASFAQETNLALNKEKEVTTQEITSDDNLTPPAAPQGKMYVSPDGKVFFKKSMPIYIWVSADPNSPAKAHKLVTEQGGTDYFRLDTEGKNTIRSPWLVDPETGKKVFPQQDVIFDVYADGMAPQTKITFADAPKYYKGGTMYYGKGLKVKLEGNDAVSGVESTFVAVNSTSEFSNYSNEFTVSNENDNEIKYYSVDNVGNTEEEKSKKFVVDVTAPVSKFALVGDVTNGVLSPNAKIVLKSEDNLSGVKDIKYKIGEGDFVKYTKPIALNQFKDGNIEVAFYASDNVGNDEQERSTNNTSDSEDGASGTDGSGGLAGLKLYVDNIAPEVDLSIQGDQFDGKYTFVSERTKVELKASDNKAGVQKITYGVNQKSRTNDYAVPFNLLPNSGVQYVNYAAVDQVNNWAKAESKTVYLDKTAPKSSVQFIGNKFNNRDTLFITKATKIKIKSFENESGVQSLNYSIDNSANTVYGDAFTFEKDGYHKLNYYGIDNVKNTEETKFVEFVIDNKSPEIKYTYSVEPIGVEKVKGNDFVTLPSNTIVYLAATDNEVGVKDIQYSINKSEYKSKTSITYFKPGKFTVHIIAYDFLGNKSEETIRFKILK